MNEFWIYRMPIMIWGAACATMAVIFAFCIIQYGSDVTPELYGRAVWIIPALDWAAFQFLCGVAGAIGAFAGVPSLAGLAFLLLTVEFLALGITSFFAGQGTVVFSGSFGVFIPISGYIAFECWRAGSES